MGRKDITFGEIYEYLEKIIGEIFGCKIDDKLKGRDGKVNKYGAWTFTNGRRNFEITIRELI